MYWQEQESGRSNVYIKEKMENRKWVEVMVYSNSKQYTLIRAGTSSSAVLQ